MSQRLKILQNNLKPQNRLKQIRSSHQLDAQELKKLLFVQDRYEKYVQPIYDFIEQNKNIFTHHNFQGQTRQEMRKEAARMTLAAMKFSKLDLVKQPSKLIYVMWAFTMFDGGILTKTALQYFLYCKSIILFGNQPQHDTLLADALALKDLGCFGLTEFYHGSYSKELQTLAVYQHQTKEFVLTTQGKKGMKYWIGAASEIANMSTIWAQLIVDGKSYGPHPFIVPLRCKKTHKVLSGITIGDCGPKNGLNYIDNGFIILDNVRVPRVNLLGKYGNVDQSGKYNSMIESNSNRFGVHMSPLSGGRGMIAFTVNVRALLAATSALRYACIRKQFDNAKKTDEVLIIDYAITKNRLIPEIAQAIVQISAGIDLARRYFQDSSSTDLKYVAQLHAISACVKARASWNCTSTTENTRSILGGHGYSAFSNFSSFFHDTDINNTWEGDNNVLLQQTSKYLMKNILKKQKGSILNLSFVWQPQAFDQDKIQQSLRNIESIDSLLKNLFIQKYNNAFKTFEELSKTYKDKHQIWLHFHSEAGNSLSLCYADYFIYTKTKEKIGQAKNEKNKQFLLKCLQLWSFSLLQRERFGSLQLRKALQNEISLLNEELTPLSVIVTDILVPSSYITGGVFSEFQGNGFSQYLNLIYSAKDTFRRVEYYGQIIDLKKNI